MTEELKPWEKAQAARKKRIAEGGESTVVRLNPIERAKLNPKSKTMAIKAMCYYCVGGELAVQTIRHCASTDCPLHPHRPYQVGATDDDDAQDGAVAAPKAVASSTPAEDIPLITLVMVQDESFE